MMGHKICFNGKIWKIIPELYLLPLLIWSTGHGGFMLGGVSHVELCKGQYVWPSGLRDVAIFGYLS